MMLEQLSDIKEGTGEKVSGVCVWIHNKEHFVLVGRWWIIEPPDCLGGKYVSTSYRKERQMSG